MSSSVAGVGGGVGWSTLETRVGAGQSAGQQGTVAPASSELGVRVDPGVANFFPINADSQSVHELRNDSARRAVVKATCSNNNSYRLRPVFALVQPGKCVALTIGRLAGGQPRNDKLNIKFILLQPDDQPNNSLFDARKPDGTLEIALIATHKPLY